LSQDYVTETFLTEVINEKEKRAKELNRLAQIEMQREARAQSLSLKQERRQKQKEDKEGRIEESGRRDVSWKLTQKPKAMAQPKTTTKIMKRKPLLQRSKQMSKSPISRNQNLESWTREVSDRLNDLRGIPKDRFPHSLRLEPKTILLPAAIFENGGVLYKTSIQGARNYQGKMLSPWEILATSSPSRAPNQLLPASNRIQELPSDQEVSSNNKNNNEDDDAEQSSDNQPPNYQLLNEDTLPQIQENQVDLSLPLENTMTTSRSNNNNLSVDENRGDLVAPLTTSINSPRQIPTATAPEDLSSMRNNPSQTSPTFGISSPSPGIAPTALDLFYDPSQPSYYSGMNINRFKRMNEATSLMKPFNAKFPRNHIITPGLYTWLYADLIVAFINSSDSNNGFAYILAVVDGLSRKSFVRPLRKPDSLGVSKALEDIFSNDMGVDLPGHTFFCTDQGREFQGRTYNTLKRWGMTPVHLSGRHKSAPVERFKYVLNIFTILNLF
jgi:hypothetical protein